MNYQKKLVKQWAEEIYNISKKATTLSYIIPYDRIESFGPSDEDAQSDICGFIFDDNKLSDEIQSIDFDNDNQRIVVMWYLPPSKEKIEEVSTGNTIRNEYRDATWKDILRLDIMRRVYDGKSMKEAIKITIRSFDSESYRHCMYEIKNQTSYNDKFEVNFFRISSDGMEKLFESINRREAIQEMLCKDIQLSEMIAQDGKHDDITVIMDYSIHPTGHLVGWHYGVDWDVDSVVNQQYIHHYIKEMIG